mmetsp:Transcript_5082/g.7015  ORF Transcript_5082/g.7015 Transcript_5082/m.7015 type:complete len:85 (+) Transcript_5082:1587-1841(+)
MKKLRVHTMFCSKQDCTTAHCVSSRYILSHYSKCKEHNCPVCVPVRETIKTNYKRRVLSTLDPSNYPTATEADMFIPDIEDRST